VYIGLGLKVIDGLLVV